MERLTPEDTSFLRMENRIAAMHSVSVAVFEGPEPDFDALRDQIGRRLGFVPRLRQRMVEVPYRLERPMWINSPQFRLGYHVRHTGLAEPTDEALADLVSRVLSQRLDRGKPLWEIWVAAGLADDRWAILSKAHHAIIDGVSGIDPLATMVDDFVPDGVEPPPFVIDQVPSERDLINRAVFDLTTNPAEQMRLMRRMLRMPGDVGGAVSRWVGTGDELSQRGPHRRWSSVSIPFDEVRGRRLASGMSTNDVLLTYVALGLRALGDFGPPWNGDEVTVCVPFAVGPGGVFTNEIDSLTTTLPVDTDDFDEALARVALRTVPDAGGRHRVRAVDMTKRRGLAALTVAALGVRRVTRDSAAAAKAADTVAVNAPGPREPLTVLDRPMVSLASAIPLAGGVPISFGIVSYVDHFTISATADLDSGIDPTVVTDAIATL